ncbi:ATP-binding protein [Dyadobacter sp. 50-39]|uniref:PAS domain-containing sensor histidine kinase n=1 Tax=Dyadobacter sp. 50-39 TaxID=1895756 RepID=UPI000AF6B66B|nr:ATP-binding protein [Dyadobacter sp. 50-39]
MATPTDQYHATSLERLRSILQAARVGTSELEITSQLVQTLITSSPTPTVVFLGRDMTVGLINDAMLTIWGKDESVIGKTLHEAMPELVDQPFLGLLQHVYDTGVPFNNPEGRADLYVGGKLETLWFNYSYNALLNDAGEAYGVINTATNVTEQVRSRKRLEEAEEVLRAAIELADLGTWQIDLRTGKVDYSPRLRFWSGIAPDEIITLARENNHVRPSDWPGIRAAFAAAIEPGSDGIYDIEFTIEPFDGNPERIMHAVGNAFFDEEGIAYKIWGTMHDVTQQRQQQRAQEWLVQKRTEELAASNDALKATVDELNEINKRLADTNEKARELNLRLGEANRDLTRSNENLQQFAYVASHDLQEPLRKVQSLGTLLSDRYGAKLGDDGMNLIDRMVRAGRRMSLLIDDLLSFSRITTRRAAPSPVALGDVIAEGMENLSALMKETGGIVEMENMPTLEGDRTQLVQLFQNLLSNAFKFHRADVTPLVHVTAAHISAEALPAHVKPARDAKSYHCITVADNGIGFDEKYLDRIFQVFQRLHGKSEYAGTGIGLSICEKVVHNHGGAITASSRVGEGAQFSVYLPKRLHESEI